VFVNSKRLLSLRGRDVLVGVIIIKEARMSV